MRPWKSIEEVQQLFRGLGMRQAIYGPDFEGPHQATVNVAMKAKILSLPQAPSVGW